MSAPRFFVDTDLSAGARVLLPATVAHHAQHALRLADGAAIVLFNGRGGEYPARLSAGREPAAIVERHDDVEREASLHVTVLQSWIATDKLDLVVEKATELGAAAIALVPAARSVVRLDAARRERRLAHLRAIVIAACQQCGRNRVPPLRAHATLDDALATHHNGLRLLLDADGSPLAATVPASADAVTVAIGPEGGFDEREKAAFVLAGWSPTRLGARVLRTETAGLAAVATLLARTGE